VPTFADAVAPAVALAQAIGRFGNYVNQELFGRPTDLPWGLQIDPVYRPEGYERFATFHSTFLYESIWTLGLALLLVVADRRLRLRPAELFATYVAGYTVGRLGIELLRIDEANTIAGLRLNVSTSVIVFLGAAAYFVFASRSTTRDVATPPAESAAVRTVVTVTSRANARRSPRSYWLAGLVAVLLLAVGAGCARPETPDVPQTRPGLPADPAPDVALGQTRIARAAREPAPELSGQTLDGRRLRVRDLEGDVVVLNVWASWCAPCEEEAPTLTALDAEFRKKGVRFVGLNVRDDPDAARDFSDRFGVTYPSILDPTGSLAARLVPWLPPQAIPGTVILDRSGQVAVSVIGKVRRAPMRTALDDLLAETIPHPSAAGRSGRR